MSDDTASVTKECGKRIINGVDLLARRFDLRAKPVPLSTKIGELGLGDNDCAIIERFVRREQRYAGKSPLIKSGAVKPSTTIKGLIDYVC
jgi:hypothetical protein